MSSAHAIKYRDALEELEKLASDQLSSLIKRLLKCRSAPAAFVREHESRQKLINTRNKLIHLFHANDQNFTGLLNYEQYASAMKSLRVQTDDQTIRTSFLNLDSNRDGFVNPEEFVSGVLGKDAREINIVGLFKTADQEIRNVELKIAQDADEIEKMLIENMMLQAEGGDGDDLSDFSTGLVSKKQDNRELDMLMVDLEETRKQLKKQKDLNITLRNELKVLKEQQETLIADLREKDNQLGHITTSLEIHYETQLRLRNDQIKKLKAEQTLMLDSHRNAIDQKMSEVIRLREDLLSREQHVTNIKQQMVSIRDNKVKEAEVILDGRNHILKLQEDLEESVRERKHLEQEIEFRLKDQETSQQIIDAKTEENEGLIKEIEQMKALVNEMNMVQGTLQNKMRTDLEAELSRMQEFASALRNQLNLLNREVVVTVRAATKKVLEMGGATDEELAQWDQESKTTHFVAQVRQVFLSLDDQHTGDMDFEKFCQAFQWLGIEAPIEDMRRTFARMDANASGLIDEQEFLLAVCDIDHSTYTPKFQLDFLMERLAELDDGLSDLVGSNMSMKLRNRLLTLKQTVNTRMAKVLHSIKDVSGFDTSKLSEDHLHANLNRLFDKYANSNSCLSFHDFTEIWRELNLEGSVDEIRSAFDLVDSDRTGFITRSDYVSTMRENRLTEMTINVLVEVVEEQLNNLATSQRANQQVLKKRKVQRKTMENKMSMQVKEMVEMLTELKGGTQRQRKRRESVSTHRELTDTFSQFDKNQTGEMNLTSYKKAWRWLGKPGNEQDIENSFRSVDVDNTGVIDCGEFVKSFMSDEEAEECGLAGDMKLLSELFSGAYTRFQQTQVSRQAQKDKLRAAQRETLVDVDSFLQKLQGVVGNAIVDGGSYTNNDAKFMTAFEAVDRQRRGKINEWQFGQAWVQLGLGGSEEEIKDAFASADQQEIDIRQFVQIVKDHRLGRIELKEKIWKMERFVDMIVQQQQALLAASQRRRLHQMKRSDDFYELLQKMVTDVLPMTDERLSKDHIGAKKRYQNLKEVFSRFDSSGQGLVDIDDYLRARRYLGNSVSEEDLESAFVAVDLHNCGYIDVNEFVYSVMGNAASKVGTLAYAKILNKLISVVSRRFSLLKQAVEHDSKRNIYRAETPTSPTPVKKYSMTHSRSQPPMSPMSHSRSPPPTASPKLDKNGVRLNARKMVQRMTGFGGSNYVARNHGEDVGLNWGERDRGAQQRYRVQFSTPSPRRDPSQKNDTSTVDIKSKEKRKRILTKGT